MPRRLSTPCTPARLKRPSPTQTWRKPASVQRLCASPNRRGERCTTSRSSSRAACAVGCREGKSGLAPAPCAYREPGEAVLDKAVEPGIDGIRFAGAEQALARHAGGAHAGVDFQEGSSALAEVGFGAMVAEFFKRRPFHGGQGKGTGHVVQPSIRTSRMYLN